MNRINFVAGALVSYRLPLDRAVKARVVAVLDAGLRISVNGTEHDVDPAHCQPILLRDVMPHEFLGEEYRATAAYALRNVPVVLEVSLCHRQTWKPWPGREKNVDYWVVLANGKAVGWNENISRGRSFPVVDISRNAGSINSGCSEL